MFIGCSLGSWEECLLLSLLRFNYFKWHDALFESLCNDWESGVYMGATLIPNLECNGVICQASNDCVHFLPWFEAQALIHHHQDNLLLYFVCTTSQAWNVWTLLITYILECTKRKLSVELEHRHEKNKAI